MIAWKQDTSSDNGQWGRAMRNVQLNLETVPRVVPFCLTVWFWAAGLSCLITNGITGWFGRLKSEFRKARDTGAKKQRVFLGSYWSHGAWILEWIRKGKTLTGDENRVAKEPGPQWGVKTGEWGKENETEQRGREEFTVDPWTTQGLRVLTITLSVLSKICI